MPLDIDQLIAQNLADGEDVVVSGGVDTQRLIEAEALPGAEFPAPYRQFLAKYGAIEIDGRSFAGLQAEGEVGDDGDVVAFTRYARKDYRLPEPYIALDFQDGDFWLRLDTSRSDGDGESPVILVSPVDGKQHGPATAPSWADYLAVYLAA
ncbi:SMI1/KNR4 family protein [Bordetella genomosp. 13]|uniref:SMI1/KNR4 family protein n=1 Tax=Bordetella genomosp. 13 TaxID=463040 RepID=UPI00119D050D|nr:SMI1/KNR4 family protein [Bordetella genomosp. 13]